MDWTTRLAELKPQVDQIIARHEGVTLSELRPMDADDYVSAARQTGLISSADADAYFGVSVWAESSTQAAADGWAR